MKANEAGESEVRKWIDLLRSKSNQDKLHAAVELGRLGVRTRGAVRTRGTLVVPAKSRLVREHLEIALAAMREAAPEVRREVAFALGEWADATAVQVLTQMAKRDNDSRVRCAAADALAKIGGPTAVKSLEEIGRGDPHEDVRATAISGLGTLALAAGAGTAAAAPVRTRGAVRTRGTTIKSPRQTKNPKVHRILQTLQQMRETDSSEYVRSLADTTLAGLGN